MVELHKQFEVLKTDGAIEKKQIIREIQELIKSADYDMVEQNEDKPWGAYFRMDGSQADTFVEEFFPGLSATEARLGNEEAELSPKILLVAPGQRLSWQYHNRRAERWAFLAPGAYNKSKTDEPGDVVEAAPGDIVQFATGERHRLIGARNGYTVVAEIWQHTEAEEPSDEEDIVRLADDYSR